MEMYHWRLIYADGRVADEPEETTSIMVCPAGAMALAVCRGPIGQREPVVMEYMAHPRLPKAGPWVPIFYRRRSMAAGAGFSSTDLVVFGRGCEGANEVHSRLWVMSAGRAIDCPDFAVDPAACESLVMESFSGVTR